MDKWRKTISCENRNPVETGIVFLLGFLFFGWGDGGSQIDLVGNKPVVESVSVAGSFVISYL